MVIVCVITCVYLWETQTYKQLAEKHRHITSAIEMDVFLGFLPFFNFNMKRRAIILKKSKGRRNPIVNFICLSFSSQFYWDIKKTAHMQCIHSDEFGNTQTLVIPASTTVKMLHTPSTSKALSRSRRGLVCLLGALFLTLISTLF